MSNCSVIDAVDKNVTPVIEGLGYEVVDVTFKKVYNVDNLTIFIHKKGGVTLDDCERVNNEIDTLIDELDITKGVAFTLNISSPGLDRPIVTDRDFERNLNEEVEVSFIKNINKKKKVHGELISYDATSFEILINGKKLIIMRDNVKLMHKYIDFIVKNN